MSRPPRPNPELVPEWPSPQAELEHLQFLYPAYRIAVTEGYWTALYLPADEPFLMEASAFKLRQKLRDLSARRKTRGTGSYC